MAIPRVFLLILFVITFSSCSVYQNVTGFFNTYYNVKKLYGEAVDEIQRTRQTDQDTNYFAIYKINQTVDDKFEKVIEKCSKLLQFYPQSSWVDDALLMIGKSYVYKGENESAIRKFAELFQNFPTSSLISEGKLWNAKALYFNHKNELTLQAITELLPEAITNDEENVIIESYMLQGQIYVEQGEYKQAAESYGRAAHVDGDGYLRAVSRFHSARNLERIGLYEEAAVEYQNVLDEKPDFGLMYRSRLRHGMMLTATKKYEQALDAFELLEEEELKPEEIGLVELEIGNTYHEMGDTAKAFTIYTFIDTTYKKTEVSARANYQRGYIYEKQFLNFKEALQYYTKSKTDLPSSAAGILAGQKVDDFDKYFKYHSAITAADTQLYHLLHPDTTVAVKDSAIHVTDSSHATGHTTVAADTSRVQKDSTALSTDVVANDSVKTFVQPPDMDQVEREMAEEREELRVRGKHEQRRGRDADRYADRDDRGESDTSNVAGEPRHRLTDTTAQKTVTEIKKPAMPVRKVPSVTPDSLRMQISRNEFELAGLFLMQLDIPDSARYWYDRVISEHPNSPFVPRSLYALAEIHRSKNDSLAVDSMYHLILTRYEHSEYADHVKKLMGMQVEEVRLDSAETQYNEASALLASGNHEQALGLFLILSKIFPESPFAPKAQYTAGWICENILMNNDSAVSLYRDLLKRYPNSAYAAAVQPKVAVKDKPESLQQYVKVKEIPLVSKQTTMQEERQIQSKGSASEKDSRSKDGINRGRGKDRGDEDIDEEEEEAEPAESDDDDGGGY